MNAGLEPGAALASEPMDRGPDFEDFGAWVLG
jgi:hypothetical protein